MAAEAITQADLGRALLARQWLLERHNETALPAIEHLMGLQAQEAKPPFVGLWSRLAAFTREDLRRLLMNRQAIRATAMRGTIHLMSARDYLKFRATLQPMLTVGMRSVLKSRVDETEIAAMAAGARAFFTGAPATFDDFRRFLLEADPSRDERAIAYAVRTHLPLAMVPDESAWSYSAAAQFTPADSWLGASHSQGDHRDDLTLRYLAAFGPASAADFQAWSGFKGAKETFDRLRPQLLTFRDEKRRELFDLPDAPRPAVGLPAPVRFLPEFDNILLAHADRARIIADAHRPLVVTKNLRVLATFLVDGSVAGTWTTERKKRRAALILKPFRRLTSEATDALIAEGDRLLQFAEPDSEAFEIRVSDP